MRIFNFSYVIHTSYKNVEQNTKLPFRYVLLNFLFLDPRLLYEKCPFLICHTLLFVNMKFPIQYELFTYKQLIKAYKHYNLYYELIFEISLISL